MTTPARWPGPPPKVAEVLSALEGVEQTDEQQWAALCPVPHHGGDGDQGASFSVGVGHQQPAVFTCFGNCEDDEVMTALDALGVGDHFRGTFKRNLTALSNVRQMRPGGAVPEQRSAAPRRDAPPPLEDQDKPYGWHDRLVDRASEREEERAALDYLLTQRGLTRETVARYKIGWDGQRYTIPVRHRTKWVNVRRYDPRATGKNKMLQAKGHGSPAMVYPAEVLAENTLPVLLCEGEWDALLAGQEGAGLYVAVTGTGGAAVPPRDLSALAGRQVFVAYDADAAGAKGAADVAGKLTAAGATAHVLDLTRVGLRHTDKHGEDLTDYFLRRGGTAEALVAEMDRVRAGAEAGDDEVYRAVMELFLASDDAALDHMGDVHTDADVLALDPPGFAVAGWVPRGFYTVLYGAPGVRKTFALLDLSRSVRAGTPWLGYATERGSVLFYQGEGLEQMQERIAAWDAHHRPDPAAVPLAPGGYLSRFVDLTQPRGVAAVVRTVRAYEREHSTRVVAVVFDPLVEFMTGEENGEGTAAVTRGLRALALYLGVGVVVGHHTNAAGDRARGADHVRMRAGAHVRMEELDDGLIGLTQEKQKNAEKLAVVVRPTPVGGSLVLLPHQSFTAAAYAVRKATEAHQGKVAYRLTASATSQAVKDEKGAERLLAAIREQPGIVQKSLLSAARGAGIGTDTLKAVLDGLVSSGRVVRRPRGPAANAPHQHWIAAQEPP